LEKKVGEGFWGMEMGKEGMMGRREWSFSFLEVVVSEKEDQRPN
jgi:hypothetical protein